MQEKTSLGTNKAFYGDRNGGKDSSTSKKDEEPVVKPMPGEWETMNQLVTGKTVGKNSPL